jgi:cytochrome P450
MSVQSAGLIPFERADFYSGNPFPTFGILREEDPVHYRQDLNTWFLTRYDDIVTVSRDPRHFSSASGVLLEQIAGGRGSTGYFRADTVATTDPPRHTELRKMVAQAFIPSSVAALESKVRDLCRRLTAEIEADTDVDFIHQVAEVVPLVVIAHILGMTDYNIADISRWSEEIVRQTKDLSPAERAESLATFGKLMDYVRTQIAGKRSHPGEDLLSILLNPELGLSEQDILVWASLMMSAGHETTRAGIANLVDVLDLHPAQMRAVAADLSLIPNAIEEMLRWRGVVNGFGRRATEDYTLRDRKIRKGDGIFMLYAAANRDPRAFDKPETFDVLAQRRRQNLAFGVGTHFCIGHAVARLETRILFEELFKRFEGWTVSERSRLSSTLRIANARLTVRFHER